MSLKGGFRSSGNGKLLAENDGKFFDEKKKKNIFTQKKGQKGWNWKGEKFLSKTAETEIYKK